jgi:hypothetical protein
MSVGADLALHDIVPHVCDAGKSAHHRDGVHGSSFALFVPLGSFVDCVHLQSIALFGMIRSPMNGVC